MEKSIGGLWSKQSAKGLAFMSGNIEIDGKKIPVVCFYNSNKKNPNEPDWRILRSTPKPQEENVVPDDINSDNIPF